MFKKTKNRDLYKDFQKSKKIFLNFVDGIRVRILYKHLYKTKK